MELNIESERTEDGIAIITVDGELHLYPAPHLKENLLAALEDDVTRIAIDMTGVHFIDSSALGVLIGGVKRLKPKDGRMVLVSTDENVNWIFQITGLNNVFDMYSTRA